MRKPSALIERLEGMQVGELLVGDGVTVRRRRDGDWDVSYGLGMARGNWITLASVVEMLWGAQLASAVSSGAPVQVTLW